MSEKISDLKDGERRNIQEQVESASASMGMNSWESYGSSPEQKKMKELIGMCCDCKSLNYCATEFGNILAICESFNIRLNGQNRIVECNLHSPKNVLSLNEMYAMATLIDPEEEKKVGFTANIKSKEEQD